MPGLPTGTVTFLFTDIEGSTTLLQRLGDHQYAEILEEHRRILRETFAEGHGQEIDTKGDAFLVAFSRARDAVGAAVAAQQALAKHSWPGGASLRVRMGLHTGEPVSETGDYVGLDVHRADRICAAGHGGQILLSQAVEVLAAPDLPPEASLRDLGTHRLRDLKEPEHLFQVVHPDLPSNFPVLKSREALPNNLPIQLTSFIGREREKAKIRRLLTTTRLLALTGSGGAGKTRLALHVAAEVLEEFPDGVWLVELAALSDPSLVPKAVASALGVVEQPGRGLTETLADSLRGKSVLVILDNCEHLVAACAHLTTALLRACPNLRVLATSREALGVAGETIWRVPSLSVPDPQRLPPLDRFMEYEAIRLFVDRAVANAPQFAVTSSNAPAVAQVCHRLDGIPLALELAAARVKVLAVEQIAARLDDCFRLLTGRSSTALPRQQTLRATMDWSFNLLSEPERVLLRRLSVFAGGWTFEAAESVCTGGSVEAATILDLLTSLVDRSLVLGETQRGEARYRLLETVRQYGWDRLMESGEDNDMRERHLTWYLELAERAAPKLKGPEQQVWLDRLEAEHDNLRAALEWSQSDPSYAESRIRMATALDRFWIFRGHWSEGRRWLEEAVPPMVDAPSHARAKVIQCAAFMALWQGDYDRATALARQGLTASRTLGDAEGIARCRTVLGHVAVHRGDYSRASKLFEDAVHLYRKLKDEWFLGIALGNLQFVARDQGDYERAEGLGAESLALFRKVGDRHYSAWALRNLGLLALRQNDHKNAAAFCRDALTLSKEAGNIWLVEQCLEGLAGAAAIEGCYAQAARLFAAAETLRNALGRRRSPADQADYDKRVASTCARLAESSFAAAWTQGTTMTLEQAIEYALAGEVD